MKIELRTERAPSWRVGIVMVVHRSCKLVDGGLEFRKVDIVSILRMAVDVVKELTKRAIQEGYGANLKVHFGSERIKIPL